MRADRRSQITSSDNPRQLTARGDPPPSTRGSPVGGSAKAKRLDLIVCVYTRVIGMILLHGVGDTRRSSRLALGSCFCIDDRHPSSGEDLRGDWQQTPLCSWLDSERHGRGRGRGL